MFGLLKHRNSSHNGCLDFRQNYCGTCKTIGKLYGHKERLFLNNDIVFLSELLSSFDGNNNVFGDLKPNLCLSLPKDQKSIPLFLKFSAAINILLAYYKTLDNIKDSKSKLSIWKLIRLSEIKNFKKAQIFLKSINFPISLIEKSIEEQFLREQKTVKFISFEENFKYYVELTGKITGEVFKHGALIMNKQELADNMYILGSKFGEIVYLIDSIKDYSEDLKKGDFNIFITYRNDSSKINFSKLKDDVIQYIWGNFASIKSSINCLPLPITKKTEYIERISNNINRSINPEFKNTCKYCNVSIKHISFKEKYNYAIQYATVFSFKKKSVFRRNVAFSLLFITILILLLILPNQVVAQNFLEIKEHSWCGNCCADCCTGCCNCCGCEKCCGKDETECCSDMGDITHEYFCTDWKNCCGCIGCLALIGFCNSGCDGCSCGTCGSNSGSTSGGTSGGTSSDSGDYKYESNFNYDSNDTYSIENSDKNTYSNEPKRVGNKGYDINYWDAGPIIHSPFDDSELYGCEITDIETGIKGTTYRARSSKDKAYSDAWEDLQNKLSDYYNR